MSSPSGLSLRDTESGPITIDVATGRVWRVGWAPDPFAWTPWQYADLGHFDGRWDDPDGVYRTLYVGDSLLGVFLEVLARFRPDVTLQAELDAIDDDDDMESRYPTAPAGVVPRDWCEPRMVGSAQLSGEYFDVRRAKSVATLRRRFGQLAADYELPDLDAAALKLFAPRRLTQTISGWAYRTITPPVQGIAFGSRHGDELSMWAIFEQPGEAETGSGALSDRSQEAIGDTLPDLADAMEIHGLRWLR